MTAQGLPNELRTEAVVMRAYTGWRRADVFRAKYRISVETEARQQVAAKQTGPITSGKKVLIFFGILGFVGLEIGGLSNHNSGGAALVGLVIGLGVAVGIAILLANAATSPKQPITKQAPRTPPLTESEKGFQSNTVGNSSDE
jgi:hypothetical protein